MPGFSGTHGNTGNKEQTKDKKTQLHFKEPLPRWEGRQRRLHVLPHFLSSWQQVRLYIKLVALRPSWWNSCAHFLVEPWCRVGEWETQRESGVCAPQNNKKPRSHKSQCKLCVCVCVYKNIRDGDQTALGAVWVRSEAWAALDMLVNEQIRQPPPQPPTALLHPALHPSPSAVTLTDCTPDPLALSWLKFYNNHRAPVATSLVFEHRDGQIDTVHIQTFSATAAHAVLWPPHLRDRATELFFNTLTHTEEYMTHRN